MVMDLCSSVTALLAVSTLLGVSLHFISELSTRRLIAAQKLLSTCIYRLHFHPLAQYPGPLLGRLTDWYNVYHAWNGDRHIDMHKLHQKYGKPNPPIHP